MAENENKNGLLLDDKPYDDSNRKKSNLDDIKVDMSNLFAEDDNVDYSKKKNSSLDDISAVSLLADEEPVYVEKKKATLDDIKVDAPVLAAEDDYVPAETKKASLDDIKVEAPILEEAAPEPVHKPKFTDTNLDEIKKKAKEKALESALNVELSEEEQKRSREAYHALKREQAAELAKIGGRKAIGNLIVGLIGCIVFIMFLGDSIAEFKPDVVDTWYVKTAPYVSYFAIAAAIFSVFMFVPAKAIKTWGQFFYTMLFFVSLIFGLFILFAKVELGIAAGMLGVSVFAFFWVMFGFGSSASMTAFYERRG